MARKSPTASPYDVHPGIRMIQGMIAGMKAKTGRSFDDWVALVKKSGPKSEKERREWLKSVHGLGTNYAWMIAERAEGRGVEDSDPEAYLKAAAGYVAAMYSGARAQLKPIHDALVELGRGLGDDVKVCPCATIVPFYRQHVFAQIKPTTSSRIDFGFALKGVKQKLPARLIDTGGLAKKDRITHRIPLTSVDEIDDDLERWLEIAYELDS